MVSRRVRRWLGYFCLFAIALSLASCRFWPLPWMNSDWPTVEALAAPQLPAWIEKVSPLGDSVEPLSQILVRFKEPLIPLEALDSPQQRTVLDKLEIQPSLPGQFRFLTPQMIGFQADKALPKATRVKITLKSGLQDLKKHRLEQDIAWTFSTENIQLKDLPGVVEGDNTPPEAIALNPTLSFQSNVELDLDSLREKTQLIPQGKTETVALQIDRKVPEKDQGQDAGAEFYPAQQSWEYTLKPRFDLDKGTPYQLIINRGLRPAQGNLTSLNPISSTVKTYGDLAYEKLEPYGLPDAGGAYGRFVNGSPQLKFNNPLKASTVVTAVTIKPEPKKGVKAVRAYDEDNFISVNPWALEPNTTYEISVNEKLTDKFGQTLAKPLKITYNTGNISPDLWAPSGLNIFPDNLSQSLRLNLSTINLPSEDYLAAYKIVEPADLVFTDSAYPNGTDKDLLPKVETWQSYRIEQKKNQNLETPIPLQEKLGKQTGMIAYGFRAKTNEYKENGKKAWREPEYYGLIQLTNLGIFAQSFPTLGLVRVNHLGDGSVVPNVQIEVYRSQLEAKNKTEVQPCAQGTTDRQGSWNISDSAWQSCLTSGKPPQLLFVVKEGQDWAFTRTDEYSGAYEYGIEADWTDGKPQAKGQIFSDRRLYQPGETGWFTANAVYLNKGILQQDQGVLYNLSLTDPNGKIEKLGTTTSNDFGTFSFKIDLKKNQPLGFYTVSAKSNQGVELSGEFQVAEFKPPNFKVDLSLDQNTVLAGQPVTITTDSQYLFGAPVQNGEVKYFVTRQKADLSPKNWEQFSFGRQWFWPEEPPVVENEVMQETDKLDAQGQNQRELIIAQDLPFPMTYRVEAQVRDVSNLSVSQSQTFTALPNDYLIGLQTNFVADAGQKLPVKVIVTDAQGQAISDQQVQVELQAMDYSSVTELEEGSAIAHNQIQYKTVAKQLLTSTAKPQTLTFTPPDGGSYRLQANFVGAKNEASATDLQLWVTGSDAINWGDRYGNNRLSMSLDKKTYKTGETATALIQSPYPEAQLYFAVVRDRVLYSTVQTVRGNAPQIQFPITEEMLPNAAVQAVLVRQGTGKSNLEQRDKLVKIGFASFNLNLDDQYLRVKVTPQNDQLAPKTRQNLSLSLTDSQNRPITGQFTVMAVNDAILQLSGYRLPDLVKTIYADQPILTRLADNRPQVVLAQIPSPLEKGWGYGGGNSAGLASTETRRNFQAIAYYEGSVLTDEQGKAQVSFNLPDDLTTWRVMAVATDGNLHFGNGESTFITTKPLVTNALLPQFARLGDRFLGGVAVSNLKSESGQLHLQGAVNNLLKFPEKSGLTVAAESGTQAYRFPLQSEKIGEGKVDFSSQLGALQDRWQVPLTIESSAVTEQVIAPGASKDSVKIPLNLQTSAINGSLTIDLSSSLLSQMLLPAQKVFSDEYLPFLENAASQLSLAANLQQLAKIYPQIATNLPLQIKADQALETLGSLQKADGGFASYPNAKEPDWLLTPQVATAIAQAKQAGFGVNASMVNQLKKDLNKLITNPGQTEICSTKECKNQLRLDSLLALADLGEQREDFLAELVEQKESLDLVSQIKLARYLSRFPQWQAQAQELTLIVTRSLYQTGRSTVINLPQSWRNSPTTIQAQALQLLISQTSAIADLDKLVQGLLDQRHNGIWPNDYDNAQAIAALVAYSQLPTEPSNFKVSVEMAGQVLGTSKFTGLNTPNYQLTIPITKLPKNSNELVLNKSGKGTLHYVTAYDYQLPGNQPGRLNGLRVTRLLHLANESAVLARQDLAIPTQPFSISTGQVFDLELEIIADRPMEHLIINDPLPAGLEAIDSSFNTAPNYQQAQASNWEINYQQIYRDRVMAYAEHLETGIYHLHYLVRSVTPGLFNWPGAKVHLQYAPETFGRCASSQLEIKEAT